MKKILFLATLFSSTYAFSQNIGETVQAFSTSDNQWYDATIKEVKDTSYFIHYSGYDPQYDEWIGRSRMKLKCPDLSYLKYVSKLVPDAFSMVDKSKRPD